MKHSIPLMAVALAAALSAPVARAQQSLKIYDNFNIAPIDASLWTSGEISRSIKGGQLHMMERQWGSTSSDSGSSYYNLGLSVDNPNAVTTMQAKITVNSLDINGCAANTDAGQSRARLLGTFFNVGTPTAGSQLGDVLAQVRVTRFSNSTDPAGVLRVQGVAVVCTSSDCNGNANTGIGNVDLGTVTVGQSVTLQLQWDKPSKTFTFSRDNGAFIGSATYAYADHSPPGDPYKSLSVKLDLPSCQSGPAATGSVDASFDNFAVNRSAAP